LYGYNDLVGAKRLWDANICDSPMVTTSSHGGKVCVHGSRCALIFSFEYRQADSLFRFALLYFPCELEPQHS
jgi:hypothetical protein